ncbi:MAG TPA: response regulator [bacterium]|nr:response regulator [bacterium]
MEEQKIQILIVEDEDPYARLICKALESKDERYVVTVAQNLQEALSILVKSKPDLIIAGCLLLDGKLVDLYYSILTVENNDAVLNSFKNILQKPLTFS